MLVSDLKNCLTSSAFLPKQSIHLEVFFVYLTCFFLQACTFLARADFKKPNTTLAFAIGDQIQPKIRDNVNAEMKIRYFSLTILDSFCGMVD